jgi:hypothetical protein
MYIEQEDYEKHFEGFQITDCVVRKKDTFYFALTEMYDTSEDAPSMYARKKRIVSCFTSKPSDQVWGHLGLKNFDTLFAGLSLYPKEQFVGVDMEGAVYVVGSGEKGIENPIAIAADGGPLRGAISKLKTIDGLTYAAGTGRTVLRRDGKNDWHGFTKEIPAIEGHGQGFFDIDGFNANDIYCVGREGDVWHYDGKEWKQVPFPSNMALWTVCCAGDGFVYIGAQAGCVFKGRGNTWQLIHKDTMTLPFNDMVWHQGKVWCTSDYGLWEIENDKVIKSTAPDEMRACAGHLSVGDGVMLLAGMYGAALHNGKEWQMLISTL